MYLGNFKARMTRAMFVFMYTFNEEALEVCERSKKVLQSSYRPLEYYEHLKRE